MRNSIFFGSIGVLAETSDLQRKAYNAALKLNGIDWQWNVGTYCSLLQDSGGQKRLSSFAGSGLDYGQIVNIHNDKQKIFDELMNDGIKPRPGCIEAIDRCKTLGGKVGFVTSTTQATINTIKKALFGSINFDDFDLITSNKVVGIPKPDKAIYDFAMNSLKLNANEIVAIEDTKTNQHAAIQSGIDCYLYPGEYATVDYQDVSSKNYIESGLDIQNLLY